MSLVRFRFWALMQAWFNGRTPAFQAGYVGSIPITRFEITLISIKYARVAQLVERDLAKVEAAGSSPVSRSNEKGSSGRMVLFRSGICIETGRPARCSEGARGDTLFSPVSRSRVTANIEQKNRTDDDQILQIKI